LNEVLNVLKQTGQIRGCMQRHRWRWLCRGDLPTSATTRDRKTCSSLFLFCFICINIFGQNKS